MLRYFGRHSVQEVANVTGRPLGTVTKQASRGLLPACGRGWETSTHE